MLFTAETKIKEILRAEEFSSVKELFIASSGSNYFVGKENMKLGDFEKDTPSWNTLDIIYGLERLFEIAKEGKQYVFPLESGASFIYMPSKKKTHSTFVLIAAGGAYGAVCNLVEAFPVAAYFNEMGYDAVCLCYRTAKAESFINGLMPEPLEDVSLCLKEIDKLNIGIHSDDYFMAGFSAGGHLAAMWGTKDKGARCYGQRDAKLIILIYPLISLKTIDGDAGEYIRMGLLGKEYTEEKVNEYSVECNVDSSYPPFYLCFALDDKTVPRNNSALIDEAATKNSVRHTIQAVSYGNHGFGLGSYTPAKDWPRRAVEFYKEGNN